MTSIRKIVELASQVPRKKRRPVKRFVIQSSWLALAESEHRMDVPYWESIVDWMDAQGLEHTIENVKTAIAAQKEKEK